MSRRRLDRGMTFSWMTLDDRIALSLKDGPGEGLRLGRRSRPRDLEDPRPCASSVLETGGISHDHQSGASLVDSAVDSTVVSAVGSETFFSLQVVFFMMAEKSLCPEQRFTCLYSLQFYTILAHLARSLTVGASPHKRFAAL